MSKEINRLVEQAESWKDETETLLQLVQPRQGWNFADLGCGPRGILDSLSEAAGPRGSVTGIDLNFSFIQAARDFTLKKKLDNIHLLQANLFDLPLENHSFDLSHVRFVFSEVGCDKMLLNEMIRITKPGGFVISQESDLNTWHCHPPQAAWKRMKEILIDYYHVSGRDINAGLRTLNMFKRSGLRYVKSRSVDLDLQIGHPYRPGLLHFIDSHWGAIMETGVAEKGELDEIKQTCQTIVNNPEIEVRSYTLYQVWGQVPLDINPLLE